MGKRARPGTSGALGRLSGAEFVEPGRLSGVFAGRRDTPGLPHEPGNASDEVRPLGQYRTKYAGGLGLASRYAAPNYAWRVAWTGYRFVTLREIVETQKQSAATGIIYGLAVGFVHRTCRPPLDHHSIARSFCGMFTTALGAVACLGRGRWH